MRPESLIVQTKLTPIRPLKRTLLRSRLTARLRQALEYRVTVLQAGTGYGKTTALAELAASDVPLVWYHLDAEDGDPLVFLMHLLHGFAETFEPLSTVPLAMLNLWGGSTPAQPLAVVDALINELNKHLNKPALLVLDDAHQLNESPETLNILERLIKHVPANLHIILSCRQLPTLNNLLALRVRGELLEINESELAFTADEITALFRE